MPDRTNYLDGSRTAASSRLCPNALLIYLFILNLGRFYLNSISVQQNIDSRT